MGWWNSDEYGPGWLGHTANDDMPTMTELLGDGEEPEDYPELVRHLAEGGDAEQALPTLEGGKQEGSWF